MFVIPDTFKSEYEDYLTLIPIKKFIEDNPEAHIKKSDSRPELLRRIEEYANIDEAKRESVEEWVDNSIIAGRKEIYIKEVEKNEILFKWLKNVSNLEQCFGQNIKEHRHVCGNSYGSEFEACKCFIENGSLGHVIRVILCKMIYSFDSKEEKTAQWYPVVVSVYLDKGFVEARVKQKTHMFKYENVLEIDEMPALTSLTPESTAKEAIMFVCSILGIRLLKNYFQATENIKGKIYNLLERSIGTPEEIEQIISDSEEKINELAVYYRNNIFYLSDQVLGEFKNDIKIIFEKYMSISREDTSIFIRDKRMYPIRLVASDEDTSKVDQTSAEKGPLQAKPIFFNNKSMIFKNKKCDGIMFSVEKEKNNTKRNRFCVRIIEKKGYCVISWFEYLKEDDINYVLRTIIEA